MFRTNKNNYRQVKIRVTQGLKDLAKRPIKMNLTMQKDEIDAPLKISYNEQADQLMIEIDDQKVESIEEVPRTTRQRADIYRISTESFFKDRKKKLTTYDYVVAEEMVQRLRLILAYDVMMQKFTAAIEGDKGLIHKASGKLSKLFGSDGQNPMTFVDNTRGTKFTVTLLA